MTDELMRAAFEAWLNPGNHRGNVSAWVAPGRYEKQTHQLAWLAWLAARKRASATPPEPARDNFHVHHVAVNKAALQMVRNALRNDVEAGRVVRGEMLAELDKATFPIPAPRPA